MGRAARNHGGTGGHGCVPLPGERPNFNRHVLSDQTLLGLVNQKKHSEVTKAKEIEWKLLKSSKDPEDDGTHKTPNEQFSLKQLLPSDQKKPNAKNSVVKDPEKDKSKKEKAIPSIPTPSVHPYMPTVTGTVSSVQMPLASVKETVSSVKLIGSSLEAPQYNNSVPIVKIPGASVEMTKSSQKITVSPLPNSMVTKHSSNESASSVKMQGASTMMPQSSVDTSVSSVQMPLASVKKTVSSVKFRGSSLEAPQYINSVPIVQIPEASVEMAKSSKKINFSQLPNSMVTKHSSNESASSVMMQGASTVMPLSSVDTSDCSIDKSLASVGTEVSSVESSGIFGFGMRSTDIDDSLQQLSSPVLLSQVK